MTAADTLDKFARATGADTDSGYRTSVRMMRDGIGEVSLVTGIDEDIILEWIRSVQS